jgi:glucose-1-phosphate adenylyltransferase
MAVDDRAACVSFDEKPAAPAACRASPGYALASMGIYVFDTDLLCAQLARDAADPARSHDFGQDLIPAPGARHRVHAHRFADSCVNMVGDRPYWRDVGTVDAYWEANMDLTHVVPELNLYDDDWPILSLQRQLPAGQVRLRRRLPRRGMARSTRWSPAAASSAAPRCAARSCSPRCASPKAA